MLRFTSWVPNLYHTSLLGYPDFFSNNMVIFNLELTSTFWLFYLQAYQLLIEICMHLCTCSNMYVHVHKCTCQCTQVVRMNMRPGIDTGYLFLSLFRLSFDREPAGTWCLLIVCRSGHSALRVHLFPLFHHPMIGFTEKCGHPEFAWVLEMETQVLMLTQQACSTEQSLQPFSEIKQWEKKICVYSVA